MNAVKDEVVKLVEKELESANEKFPLFQSVHEGYAVILEEIEETEEQLEYCKSEVNAIWSGVKRNRSNKTCANALKEYATDLAVEAIQVAAMAQKFIDSAKDKE